MLSIHKFYVKPILNPGKGYVTNYLQCLNTDASCKLEAGITVQAASCKLLTKMAAGNN